MNMLLVAEKTLQLKSPSFAGNGSIPVQFTCDGENMNPELTVLGIPDGTMSLALIMEDPDAPGGTFDHWIMWNIPPRDRIAENSSPGAQGRNSRNENKYCGPCPPSGVHHYYFTVYALDTRLALPITTGKNELLRAMQGHVLGSSTLVGIYKR
jgi:Raf kinase inhibitor-like YbhB/YbcL family protein